MRAFISFVPLFGAFALVQAVPTLKSRQASNLTYITLEEHYDPPAIIPLQTNPVYRILADAFGPSYAATEKVLQNVNGSRMDSMNKNGIRIQVISNDPMPEALSNISAVQTANDQIAAAIAPYPTRFRGFCYLPMAYPTVAATELNRCISQLGLVGALVDSHTLNETFYDSPLYDPFWSMAQDLDVPIYLHPTYPSIQDVNSTLGRFKPENGDFSLSVAGTLGTSGYGWHSDNGLQFLRLWLGGVFDRFPDVKVVLGHMGETLPYMLERANSTMGALKGGGRDLLDVYAENVWITTSGFFSLGPFATLMKTTDVGRILFSVDYPWATNEDGVGFMETLKASGMVNQTEWEGIAYGNAEMLLKLT